MKRFMLTIGLLGFAVPVAIAPSHGYEGPWCAYEASGSNSHATRCDLPNYEACRDWIRSQAGTWCTQNPRYVPIEPRRTPRQRRQ